jgi:hypothetical protein
MTISFIREYVNSTDTTFMDHHEGSTNVPMYEHYTDAENTGAPLVPYVEEPNNTATDGGQSQTQELEEVVFSHRIQD